MNSRILISPAQAWGFKPIICGKQFSKQLLSTHCKVLIVTPPHKNPERHNFTSLGIQPRRTFVELKANPGRIMICTSRSIDLLTVAISIKDNNYGIFDSVK